MEQMPGSTPMVYPTSARIAIWRNQHSPRLFVANPRNMGMDAAPAEISVK